MHRLGLKIIILLTLIVGFVVPSQAQVQPTDSSDFHMDSIAISPFYQNPSDTNLKKTDKIRLSPDSVYSTNADGFLEDNVDYTAEDSIVGSPGDGSAELYNKAYVKYQDITLEAGYIKIDFNTSTLFARGIRDTSGKMVQKPLFTEGGKTYRADEMRYNFETKKAKIKKVITQEGEGFLHGEDVKKFGENILFIKNASYTTCSHEHPHFRIRTNKAKVIPGEKVVTQFAYLELLDIPTFLMVPFGFFPTQTKKKSGILVPAYGSSPFRGYFLKDGGFYWAGTDHVDLSIKGDIYTQGGWGLRALSNYKKRYAYSGNLSLSYNLIRFGREEFAEYNSSAFDNRSDFGIRWTHNQDPKAHPNFRFNANVNIASATFYQVTSTNPQDILTNQLASSVSINKSWPGKPFNLSVSARHNQNNATKALSFTLPQATFSVNRLFPFKKKVAVGKKKWFEEIGITYTANTANEIRTTLDADIFNRETLLDNARNGISHSIPISANYKIFNNFVLNPSVNYTERWYFKRQDYRFVDSTNSITSDTSSGFFANRDFSAQVNLSTKAYGTFYFKGYLKALRHVLTPTVGLSYRPDFSDEFWGYYQTVQSDSLGNTELRDRYISQLYGSAGSGKQGNVNFGLQNILEAKVRSSKDSSGIKKVKIFERMSLNTSYNMAADEFNWQPLRIAATSTVLNGLVNLNFNSSYSFYGYDEELGSAVNESSLNTNGKLLRPLRETLASGINLNANTFKSKSKKKNTGEKKKKEEGGKEDENTPKLGITEGDLNYYDPRVKIDFKPTWNLRLSYSLTKSYNGLASTVSQAVQASGDVQLSQNWKFNFTTGYDLERKDFTVTSFNFFRSLHCWEMQCAWIPFGFQQSYTLSIRVNSSVLSDLKYERRRGVGDFER